MSVNAQLLLHPLHGKRRIMTNIPRVRDRIPPALREVIGRCCTGKSPWPLFVSGPAGCGKTCAALYLADRVVRSAAYRDFGELCSELASAKTGTLWWQGTHAESKIDPKAYWAHWESYALTIVDEIGTRATVSDHTYETLKAAIDHRYGKPAVLLSNLSIEELARVFDDRIASRCAGGTVVSVVGEDMRLAHARGAE